MEKRLQNILARAGIASRRKSAELIERGRVRIDGKVVREKGARIDPSAHEISVDGNPVEGEERKLYFILNKPAGMITTVSDTHGRKKVSDLFKNVRERLYPVGRLDKDTTGILIMTNDGELANRLAHPRYEIEKEYMAIVEGPVGDRDIHRLRAGVEMEGKKTSPCEIDFLGYKEKGALYRVCIHEGRKRQIRVMFESVGGKVVSLERTAYAGLSLGKLKPGEYRSLTEKEVKRLMRDTGYGNRGR